MGKKYKINIPEEEFKIIGNVNQAVSAAQRYMCNANVTLELLAQPR
ncbi:MAG TPA: hypothetical protein VJN43_16295 [Bryobacteraceae bacterium]|nr:hypothetical protein [Bryobacteraceae bacterium]